MITKELRNALNDYISKFYISEAPVSGRIEIPSNAWDDIPFSDDVEKDAGKSFTNKETFTLDQLVNEVGESFHDMLFLKIDMSGMTDVEVYKRANIDRKLFSKIRSNPAYHPRKHTVLALAIALKLNIDDTIDLLSRAEYALSPSNKGDLIVKYFIEHEVFDIMTINFALDEYGQQILE